MGDEILVAMVAMPLAGKVVAMRVAATAEMGTAIRSGARRLATEPSAEELWGVSTPVGMAGTRPGALVVGTRLGVMVGLVMAIPTGVTLLATGPRAPRPSEAAAEVERAATPSRQAQGPRTGEMAMKHVWTTHASTTTDVRWLSTSMTQCKTHHVTYWPVSDDLLVGGH
jgi:hypothetical protein